MGLYDDIDKEVLGQTDTSNNNTTKHQEPKGIFDDIDKISGIESPVLFYIADRSI